MDNAEETYELFGDHGEYTVPLYRDVPGLNAHEAALYLGKSLGYVKCYCPGRCDPAEDEGRVIAAFRCGWLVAKP